MFTKHDNATHCLRKKDKMKNKAGKPKSNKRHTGIQFQLLKCILERCYALDTNKIVLF